MKHTLDGQPIETVSVKTALEFCYKNETRYCNGFDNPRESIRQFECLIEILRGGTIKPADLSDYGMSDQNL